MTKAELISEIKRKKSFLCIGLDTDIDKIPKHLLSFDDPIFEFNKEIIDATKDFCVAYKPNIAFYESCGPKGWESLKKTIDYIPKNIFTIADAKRGDIGNTCNYYAKTFFEYINCDALTIAPYMGEDSISPFLAYKNKWSIVLALTSNEGANDFQFIKSKENKELFKSILEKSISLGTSDNLMFVVGATRSENIGEVRKIAKDHFFLVPGIGSQGGSLEDVVKYGWNDSCGLLINSSRNIIYASQGEDFALCASKEARKIKIEMEKVLIKKNFI